MGKQAKLSPGDVYALPFSAGLILLQHVVTGKDRIDVVRVFRVEREAADVLNVAGIVSGKETFFLHFALKGAAQRRIVSFVGHFNLPYGCSAPRYMRTMLRKGAKSAPQWYIVDTETLIRTPIAELADEVVRLSPFGVWNPAFLIDRMNEGWSLTSWQ